MKKTLLCIIGLTLCCLILEKIASAESYSYNLYGNDSIGRDIQYATLTVSDVTDTSATFTFDTSWYAKQNQFVMGDVGINLNPAMGEITMDSITPVFYSHTDYLSSTAKNRNMDGFGLFNNMFYGGINGSNGGLQSIQIRLSWSNGIPEWTDLLTLNNRQYLSAAKILNGTTGLTGFAGANATTPIPTPLLLLCSGLLGLLGIRRRMA